MEEITIDLKDLFQVVMANKKKIAAITAAFMIAGGAYLLVAPPVYQSTSLLRIKQDKGLAIRFCPKYPAAMPWTTSSA